MGWERGHEVLLALVLSNKLPASKLVALLRSRPLHAIAQAGATHLVAGFGLSDDDIASVADAEAEAARVCEKLRDNHTRMVALSEAEYPLLLREIPSPPPLVFFRGTLLDSDVRALAIVGSRRPSIGGAGMAGDLARDLALGGFTIVSGMARGIDTAAHWGALEGGGRTIAVLASGIDVIYPRENADLAEAIARRGALLTEFPPGSAPLRCNFPRRNRLISGLALGTLVVEAGEKSGALITADFALDQNRQVFAVPGSPGYARSKGANRLLKEGARLVESAEDVFEDLGPQLKGPGQQLAMVLDPDLAPEEEQVISLLSEAPAHVDEIVRHLGRDAHTVLGLLLSLETKGLVRSLPGKFYIRNRVN